MAYQISKQHRLPGYDYTQEGAYFITICTKNKVCAFGQVVHGEMKLSPVGEMAKQFWSELPMKWKNVILDQSVIMPDHMHGIIILNSQDLGGDLSGTLSGNAPRRVPTETQPPTGIQPLIKNSISSIVNHFKGNVKRWCNKNGFGHFEWQSRFHDRIIRDAKEFFCIQEYIRNNPAKWSRNKAV